MGEKHSQAKQFIRKNKKGFEFQEELLMGKFKINRVEAWKILSRLRKENLISKKEIMICKHCNQNSKTLRFCSHCEGELDLPVDVYEVN